VALALLRAVTAVAAAIAADLGEISSATAAAAEAEAAEVVAAAAGAVVAACLEAWNCCSKWCCTKSLLLVVDEDEDLTEEESFDMFSAAANAAAARSAMLLLFNVPVTFPLTPPPPLLVAEEGSDMGQEAERASRVFVEAEGVGSEAVEGEGTGRLIRLKLGGRKEAGKSLRLAEVGDTSSSLFLRPSTMNTPLPLIIVLPFILEAPPPLKFNSGAARFTDRLAVVILVDRPCSPPPLPLKLLPMEDDKEDDKEAAGPEPAAEVAAAAVATAAAAAAVSMLKEEPCTNWRSLVSGSCSGLASAAWVPFTECMAKISWSKVSISPLLASKRRAASARSSRPLSLSHFLRADELNRFFTAFSVRPGKSFAISDQRLPHIL
jgi:hypothetical protein